jgi:predicted anti-sigma-YlaC factor YlaD
MNTMNCSDARDLLQAHLDGDLPPETRHAVAAHLRACPACAAEVKTYERLFRRLTTQPIAPPPADFVPGIMERARSARALSMRWMTLKMCAAAACLVLAVLLGYRALHPIRPAPLSVPSHTTQATPAAPDLGLALASLWGLVSDAFLSGPDYSQDVIAGAERLVAPLRSCVNDAFTPAPEANLPPSLG